MKLRFIIGLALTASLCACSRETDQTPDQPDGKTVITASIEKWTPADPGSKTFVAGGTEIHWSSSDADKVLYVFDSKGARNVFTSAETQASAKRSFSGTISADSEYRSALWSGKVAADDKSSLAGGSTADSPVFTGSSLRVVNPQNITSAGSFAQDANIAVMKSGEGVLRNVFGYIRFTVPAGDGGHATIKSVTFSADEDFAGEIQIDYSGSDPVASIVADSSKSLTVNMNKQGDNYEAGTLFAVLPTGTYHNMSVTVMPVTGESVTFKSKSEVVIKRGQYTDAGTLSSESARKPVLHLAGDSLCAPYGESSAPQCGWGQCLSAALCGAEVDNRGYGGTSTKSYIDTGRWDNLLSAIVPGDLVLIMFAHNDGSSEEARHTDPNTTYKENLNRFINETTAAGGTPVLLTSISSRYFNGNTLKHTTADYATAMREVATATGTALIDINEQTYQFFNNLGVAGTEPYFVMDKRNPTSMDNVHITRNGAELVASMIAHGLKDLGLWKYPISEEPLVVGLVTISSSQAFSFESAGGTASITFTSTKNWKVSSSASWVQVSPASGAAGENSSITITVAASALNEMRSSYVTIGCDGYAKHVTITQSGVEGGSGETPNAEDSFDYGLAPGESRTASYTGYAAAGIESQKNIPEPVLLNKVVYGGPGITFYGNRMTAHKVNNEWNTEYSGIIPSSRYFSFKINRPGSITFYQSIGSGIERIPTYYLAIVVSRGGARSAKIVDSLTPTEVTEARPGSAASGDPKYFVTMTVPASEFEGVSDPITVYLYHRWTSGNTCLVHYYPFTWTSWDGSI
ncbi:MAG: hypothetical protein J5737_04240 [Bacteroidales bacterium]|nr:hypothetical protein [Bacteroidales bacterium]